MYTLDEASGFPRFCETHDVQVFQNTIKLANEANVSMIGNDDSAISKIYFSLAESNFHNQFLAQKLGEINHEINNPLAIVMSSLKILEKSLKKHNLEGEELFEENIKDIKQSIDRIKSIMVQARSLAEDSKFLFENVSIKQLLSGIKSYFSLIFSELNIEFVVNIDSQIENVSLDVVGTTFGQCLFNLVNNAYFEVKKKPLNRSIKIHVKPEGDQAVMFSIIDSGAGVPSEIRSKIFNLNFSTKGEDGSGIGLYLVQKYVELNKGRISLDEKYVDGAKFDIVIPIGNSDITKKTVLIVDDELDLLQSLEELIQEKCTVLIASNVNEAFRLLKNNKVDIIISDFKMPLLTGYDFLKMVRGLNLNVPFIIFSSFLSDATIKLFESEKNVKILEKPYFEKLSDEIESML